MSWDSVCLGELLRGLERDEQHDVLKIPSGEPGGREKLVQLQAWADHAVDAADQHHASSAAKVPAQPVRPKIGVPSAIIPRPSLAKLSPIR